jgi:hypothetical protein
MKKFLFSFLLLFFLFSVVYAQSTPKKETKPNVEITKDGNFVAVTSTKIAFTDTITDKTYTDSKGTVYPVYKSKNEKLYIWKTSRNGNLYKFYLKPE